MDCGVCLDQSDGEAAEFFHEEERVAKRVHMCCECEDQIPVGETHQVVQMKYDGRWSTYRTCNACVEVHRALSSCDREDGSPGYRGLRCLWVDLEEWIFPEMTTACIAKCRTVAAREKLLKRWNEWKFR